MTHEISERKAKRLNTWVSALLWEDAHHEGAQWLGL